MAASIMKCALTWQYHDENSKSRLTHRQYVKWPKSKVVGRHDSWSHILGVAVNCAEKAAFSA